MVILDERIVISTPEGVDLEASVAGVGTRFLAILVDLSVWLLLFVILGIFVSLSRIASRQLSSIVGVVGIFVIVFGYDIICETFNRGRTPGKAALGLRVIQVDGNREGFFNSAIRNLVRLIEVFLFPIIAVTAITTSAKRQRVGDMLANTVVINERAARAPALQLLLPAAYLDDAPFLLWDTSAVSAADLAVVRRFLERRSMLVPAARWSIGSDLADRIKQRVGGAPDGWQPEAFLEAVVAAKAARDRR